MRELHGSQAGLFSICFPANQAAPQALRVLAPLIQRLARPLSVTVHGFRLSESPLAGLDAEAFASRSYVSNGHSRFCSVLLADVVVARTIASGHQRSV